MFQFAQDVVKALHCRFRSTVQMVAEVAQTLGLPPGATALLQMLGGQGGDMPSGRADVGSPWMSPQPPPRDFAASPEPAEASVDEDDMVDWTREETYVEPEARAQPLTAQPAIEVPATPVPAPAPAPIPEAAASARVKAPAEKAEKKKPAKAQARRTGKRRDLKGPRDSSDKVRPLKVEDAIKGSTYLARIVWSLGVAHMEELGPLRPADIARMIMQRSPVSLEPPNVARYIRRSKPRYIEVASTEGSSCFYALNEEGLRLFQEKFKVG